MAHVLTVHLISKPELSFNKMLQYICKNFPAPFDSVDGNSSTYEVTIHLPDKLNDVQRDWLHISTFAARYVDSYDVASPTMTVRELIELLSKCNPDDIVILSKDAEGNGFSPLSNIQEEMYTPDTTYSGEISLRALTPELAERGFTEDEVGNPEDGAVNCVTLYPTN